MQIDVHPFDTLSDALSWAIAQIDNAAGQACSRHLTITPGQSAIYQAKNADAAAFVKAGYPEADLASYAWISAEVEATGKTAKVATDDIKAAADSWSKTIGPNIEKHRINGKQKIRKLTTIAEVIASVRETEAKLHNS